MEKIAVILGLIVSIPMFGKAQNWTNIASGTTKKLNTIEFVGNNIGYIGGDDSLLLKTTDGGITWNEVNYSGVNFFPGGEDILKIDFVNESVGFMTVGPYSGAYKTVDGGLNWEAIFSSATSNLCFNQGLFFLDENNGFIGGAGCFSSEVVEKLENGLWSEVYPEGNSTNNDIITDIDFLNPLKGLAASSGGYILKTNDGGNSWERISIDLIDNSIDPTSNEIITSVDLISEMIAVATFNSNSLVGGKIISYDGGLSWSLLDESYTALEVHHSTNGITYFSEGIPSCGIAYVITSTSDFNGWESDYVGMAIYGITSLPNLKVFVVGEAGTILMKESHSQTSSVLSIKKELECTVFPNPVENMLTLSFSPTSTNATASIMDLEGKIVLVSDIVSDRLDVSKLSSGMYRLTMFSGEKQFQISFVKK